MSNVDPGRAVSGASTAQHMRAGSFFGAMQGKREQCGAIFTEFAPFRSPHAPHTCSTVWMVNATAAAKPSRFPLRPSPPDVSVPFLSFV